MIFSENGGKVTKIVEPGQIEFMIHAEAAPGAEEFAKGAQCLYKEAYWFYTLFSKHEITLKCLNFFY